VTPLQVATTVRQFVLLSATDHGLRKGSRAREGLSRCSMYDRCSRISIYYEIKRKFPLHPLASPCIASSDRTSVHHVGSLREPRQPAEAPLCGRGLAPRCSETLIVRLRCRRRAGSRLPRAAKRRGQPERKLFCDSTMSSDADLAARVQAPCRLHLVAVLRLLDS
jgi:hypothetical protein